jgi:membrane protein YdbS with pleckstrin-like domain
MTENPVVKEVRPHRNLRALYLTYLLFVIWAGVLSWLVPLSIVLPPFQTLFISLTLLLMVAVAVWWTGAYVRTIIYRFDSSGIWWEKGVFINRSGFIPFHLIAGVDIVQGPVYRLFGLYRLKIHVVEHSSSAHFTYIRGLTRPEPFRDYILFQQQQAQPPLSGNV